MLELKCCANTKQRTHRPKKSTKSKIFLISLIFTIARSALWKSRCILLVKPCVADPIERKWRFILISQMTTAAIAASDTRSQMPIQLRSFQWLQREASNSGHKLKTVKPKPYRNCSCVPYAVPYWRSRYDRVVLRSCSRTALLPCRYGTEYGTVQSTVQLRIPNHVPKTYDMRSDDDGHVVADIPLIH